jgi:hypothetical protein
MKRGAAEGREGETKGSIQALVDQYSVVCASRCVRAAACTRVSRCLCVCVFVCVCASVFVCVAASGV